MTCEDAVRPQAAVEAKRPSIRSARRTRRAVLIDMKEEGAHVYTTLTVDRECRPTR